MDHNAAFWNPRVVLRIEALIGTIKLETTSAEA
jgi:hypothetical protein